MCAGRGHAWNLYGKMKLWLLGLAILATHCAVQADILFWQVDQTELASPVEFAFAKVVDANTKTGLSLYDSEGELTSVSAAAANNADSTTDLGTATDGLYAQLGDSTDISFLQVLLYGTSGDLVGQSDATAYSLLAPYVFKSVDDLSAGRPWTPSVTASTPTPPSPGDLPEPAEGMLILLGGAALALRRKQRNAAVAHT